MYLILLYAILCSWWNQMVVCLHSTYYTKTCNKATIYINKLLLAPFTPFDIKYKKLSLMRKTSGNVFLGAFRKVNSLYFPKVALNHGGYFCESCYTIPSKSFPTSKLELWGSLWQKIGNNWKLLLTAVTQTFKRNLTGLLDLTLKQINNFRLRQ